MLTQTWAIMVDAYRELNSKKLFWIIMALTLAVGLSFAAIGINEHGLTILWFSLESVFNTAMFSESDFYKFMFSYVGVAWWLSWFSSILALVATAGIFPDLISSGSIELTLSKPISRLRVFFTKFASGLLFTALQVTLFTVVIFFVLGLRAGSWEPGLFLIIPFMVLFFSFLFAVCVLLGVVTRSTLAALLITLLLWLCVNYAIHTFERMMLTSKVLYQVKIERSESRLQEARDNLANPVKAGKRWEDQVANQTKKLAELTAQRDTASLRHKLVFSLKTLLPKTSETLELLDRTLIDQANLNKGDDENATPPAFMAGTSPEDFADIGKASKRTAEIINARPWYWIVGTSLIFEGVILSVAAWLFCRRDF